MFGRSCVQRYAHVLIGMFYVMVPTQRWSLMYVLFLSVQRVFEGIASPKFQVQ